MLEIHIDGKDEARIRELAEKCHIWPQNYARQIIESWLIDNRSGKVRIDPESYAARNPDPLVEEEAGRKW